MGMRVALSSLVVTLAVAVGGPAEAARKAVVLLIPQDNGAWAPAVKFTEYLESSVDKNSAYTLRGNDKILGDATPTDAMELRKKLSARMAEAKKLFASGSLDDAEAIFREVIGGFDRAAAAYEKCSDFCDAHAYLSSTQLMKGEEEVARETLRALLAIDMGYRFEGPGFGQNFQIMYRAVRAAVQKEGLLGAMNVRTSPAGARVYLDGSFKGYSPMQLERVPVGKHLL
ncbi:MAG: PEGA domain-containing protein, partial [Myxococcales bacterium]